MERYIDLHIHSTASDGTKTPSELILHTKENGLSAVALTDHDTVSGIREFFDAGSLNGIETVAGVEISAKYDTEMHILGLFINPEDKTLLDRLDVLRNSRRNRNEEILRLVREYGFDISEEDVTGQKTGGGLENTGRAHMARAMVKKGYASSVQDAFDRFLKRGNPCYAERKTFSPKESIEMIKDAGGLAVLAHPIFITRDYKTLYSLLSELKGYGLDGVECYYSEYTKEYMNMCIDICTKLDLLESGGSDFHDRNKPDIHIGKVCGGMNIPYSILKKMKKRLGID